MRRKFAIILSLIMFSQSVAFAKYLDNNEEVMDSVYKFDVGDFVKEDDEVVHRDVYQDAIDIVCALGIMETNDKGDFAGEESLSNNDFINALKALKVNAYIGGEVIDGSITFAQAFEAMVSALGYDIYKTLNNDSGSWVYKTAVMLGLNKNLDVTLNKTIQRREFAQMLVNSFDVSIGKTDYNGNFDVVEDMNILSQNLDIYEISGFVNGNEMYNIYSGSAAGKDTIEIDKEEYKCYNSDYALNFIGKRVTGYVYVSDYNEREILYLTDDKKDNSVLINFNNIFDVEDYIKYEADGKEKKINIKNIEYVIFNGKKVNVSALYDYTKYDGTVLISSTDKNSHYNCMIINTYSYYVIHSVDKHEEQIYLKDNALFEGENYIDLGNDGKIICSLDKELCEYTSLSAGQSIRVWQNTEKTFTVIEASSEQVSGKVAEIDNENGIIRIGTEEYYLSSRFRNAGKETEFKSGDYGRFYVTVDRYIAGFKNGDVTTYAYLSKVFEDDENDTVKCNLFTQDNKWVTLELKKKITLDGVKGVERNAALQRIKDENIDKTIVRFKQNSEDEIMFLDTLIDTEDEAGDEMRLKLAFDGNVTQSWIGGTWFRTDLAPRMENGTPVFQIPEDESKTERFKCTDSSTLSDDEKEIYIKMYTVDDFNFARVALMGEAQQSLDWETQYWFYIERVLTTWDEDEEELAYQLIGKRMQIGKIDSVTDYELYVSESVKTKIEEKYPNGIAAGSLLKATYSSDSYLINAEVKFKNAVLPDEFIGDNNSYYYKLFCGNIIDIDTERLSRGYVAVQALSRKYYFPINNLIIIDKDTKKARAGSVGDLHIGEKMYVYKGAGGGRICAVVR